MDRYQRAFGYRNLLACDGSVLPTSPGVNPSLTITALAEHAISHVPTARPDPPSDDAHDPFTTEERHIGHGHLVPHPTERIGAR